MDLQGVFAEIRDFLRFEGSCTRILREQVHPENIKNPQKIATKSVKMSELRLSQCTHFAHGRFKTLEVAEQNCYASNTQPRIFEAPFLEK